MRTIFDRVDYFIDRLLGEKGYTFLISMSRYIVSLFSVALFAICLAHFVINGYPWSGSRLENPGSEAFSQNLILASSASQNEMRVS